MAQIKLDKDSGIKHIITEYGIALCGLQEGWTTRDQKPVKKKWGCTCGDCQDELRDLKNIRLERN